MESAMEKLCEELVKWRDSEIRKGNMLKARLIQKVISRKKSRRTKQYNPRQF